MNGERLMTIAAIIVVLLYLAMIIKVSGGSYVEPCDQACGHARGLVDTLLALL